jgi:threonine dehydrogenase-like Zn-dependent dehydrogenase
VTFISCLSDSRGLPAGKNIVLIASVIPDPGVDFPDAVSLIEQGRFSTEGIFTHTMPLSEVQRGFEIASQYLEEVVKLVIEL